MFWKIFLFEIQNRLRRPAVYLYFLAALIFTVGTFCYRLIASRRKGTHQLPLPNRHVVFGNNYDDDACKLVYYGNALVPRYRVQH
jgi:hypothetical protein